MQKIALIFHLLGASVWVGGHLYLVLCLLPSILKDRDVARLLAFEKSFEKLGMSALIIQVLTGLYLIKQLLPDMALWLGGAGVLSALVMMKLSLLALTVLTALSAQLLVIPRLSTQNLPLMAGHVVVITLLALAFLLTGVTFRF